MDKFTWNRYDDSQGVGSPFQRLRLNAEFRLLFADRVHKHLFNGGALSEQASIDRYLALTDHIDKAIVAESARWGDTQDNTPYGNTASSSTNPNSDHYPPTINNPIYFTREQHWVVERDNVINNYIPSLYDTSNSYATLNELRNENLYPSIDPPVYAQHGGSVPSGHNLVVTTGNGTIYYTTDGSDPRNTGGSINPAALSLTSGQSITLNNTLTLTARALHNGEWSACTVAEFIVGTPAINGNLVISELHYNPLGAEDDTEFIELMNIHPTDPIDLTDVSFIGIDYTFPSGFLIPPLTRIVLVKNPTAFAAAYNTAGMTIAPGSFSTTSLRNSGEEIALLDFGGADIIRFTYSDDHPWPTSPDGTGPSLVLIDPTSNPDHNLYSSWRPSTTSGGNPGTTDATTFTGDPNADLDGDGLNALLEYALGTDDTDPNPCDTPIASYPLADDGNNTSTPHLALTYTRNLAADDLSYIIQTSPDLITWSDLTDPPTTFLDQGDGTALITHQAGAVNSAPIQFIRLKVIQN